MIPNKTFKFIGFLEVPVNLLDVSKFINFEEKKKAIEIRLKFYWGPSRISVEFQ